MKEGTMKSDIADSNGVVPQVWTVVEAARFLRINEKTLRRAIHRGEIPHRRIGRLIRLYSDAVMEWLAGEEKK